MNCFNFPSIYPVKLHLSVINGLLFADDIVLLAISKIQMQRKLDLLYEYLSNLQLSINLDKTKFMVFRKGGNLSKKTKLYIDTSQIQHTKEYLYLGIPFSEIKFLNHICLRFPNLVPFLQ